MNGPGLAAAPSFLSPGRPCNGCFWRGLLWLVLTPGPWPGSGGLPGWVRHLLSAGSAFSRARRHPRPPPWGEPARRS